MDQFKKKLRTRIILLCAVLLLFVAILLYNQFGASSALRDSLAFSFQCGFSAAGSLVLVFWLMKTRGALKDEAKLRLLYNAEKDERMSAIRAKAGIPMVLILSMLLVLAGMVIGYFDETVFVVLICVALFQLLVSLGVKLYYKIKM
ncbi:MAG TPA: hypothetical protein VN538_11715 [Clostridia bacterium]|nr:hypothetical protein [Clostridia bacterium]